MKVVVAVVVAALHLESWLCGALHLSWWSCVVVADIVEEDAILRVDRHSGEPWELK